MENSSQLPISESSFDENKPKQTPSFLCGKEEAIQNISIQPRAFGTSIMNITNILKFPFQKPKKSSFPHLDFAKKTEEKQPKSDSFNIQTSTCELCIAPTNQLMHCLEYAPDIDKYMLENENKNQPKLGYMTRQPDVNEKMRSILVDWIVDVHVKFQLFPETLFLTINILDRYLEKELVPRDKLQLVGITSILIASKYEEIYPPELRDLVYITDNAYSSGEIIDMECKMLQKLEFNISTFSSYRFLQRYCAQMSATNQISCLAQYLIELSLIEYRALKYSQSIKAAAALYLADRLINGTSKWDFNMAEKTKFKEIGLKPCAKDLATMMQLVGKSSLHAVRKKFSSSKFMGVAKLKISK